MKKLMFLVLAISVLFTGCSGTAVVPVYKKITATEAKKMIDSDKNITILDVRTLSEYDEGHIKGSILITDTELKVKVGNVLKDKNKTILVYCRSGRRSKDSAEILIQMGYKNVLDFGGIIDWTYETEK